MLFLRHLLVLLAIAFSVQNSSAETLYERSLVLFNGLASKANPDDFSFVVLGDSRDGEVIFRKALKLSKSLKPLFVLHGGDYSSRGGETETTRFLSLVNETAPELPLFVLMGNHENSGIFFRRIGPLDFTLESKRLGLLLVAVDNSDYVLKPKEVDYLRTHLAAPARARFVAMHIPPKTERWSWHTFTDGAEELKKILATSKVHGAFFSHVHLYDSDEYGGVPAMITGGAGAPLTTFGFPGDAIYHVLLVRVKDGKAFFSKVPIPKS